MKKESLVAIVSGFVNYSERDRIVRVISASQGKISIMVKNARSAKSRHAGMFDIGNRVQLLLSAPKQGDLWKLHEVDLLQDYGNVHRNVQKLALMIYCCEIIEHLSIVGEPAPRLYGLLENSLALLDSIDAPQHAFHLAFESKALSFAGVQPNLRSCIHCAKPISNPSLYQPILGGAIHRHCNDHLQNELRQKSLPSSTTWLEQIEHLLYSPIADTHSLGVQYGENWSLARNIEEQTERTLKSKSFLQSLYP